MELILLIFKIILFVLIAVVGICLFLIGLLLFVPIHYEVSGSVEDSWEFKIKGKLTYLLSLVKLIFSYEEEVFDASLVLFGIKKHLTQEDTIASEENRTEESTVNQTKEKDAKILYTDDDEADVEADVREVYSDIEKESQSDDDADETWDAVDWDDISEEPENTSAKKKSKVSRKQKAKKESSEKLFDFAFWKNELTDEQNKTVVRKLFSELVYLLKHFRFRKIQTDIVFATGDPAATGQVLGVLCVIPLLYRYQFRIVPDFEADTFYIKGTFAVAGKIRLIHLLMTVLRLIFDKEVRLVYNKVMTLLDN